jgi:hypothetical protein
MRPTQHPKGRAQSADVTLGSFPRGYVTSATIYGHETPSPGLEENFRKAMRYLTEEQMRAITEELGSGKSS